MKNIFLLITIVMAFFVEIHSESLQKTDSSAHNDSLYFPKVKTSSRLLFGGSFLFPGDYNLILGGEFRKILVRLEVGMTSKINDPSYQFNIGMVLDSRKHFSTHASIGFGSTRVISPLQNAWSPYSGVYEDGSTGWGYIALCWDVIFYGIFAEMGYGLGDGSSRNNGKAFAQIGYIFIL